MIAPRNGHPEVELIEESLREGMQIESVSITLEQKLELLDALVNSGLKTIVVGSFVSPKWTPQMADIDELISRIRPVSGVRYTALALNDRGRERYAALSPPLSPPAGPPRTLAHVCDVFVRRNTNRAQADEIAGWPRTVAMWRDRGLTEAGIGINAAWGSNWLGKFSLEQRMSLLERQHELWTAAGIRVTSVWIGDPMAWNLPDEVAEQIAVLIREWPNIERYHLHLHNARGSAPISAYAALKELDWRHTLALDVAVGGIGGCPYCGHGRLTRMIPTEDIVDLFTEMGIDTGVDRDRIIDAALVAERIIGRPLYGHVAKTGQRPRGDRLFPMDMPFVETEEQAQHFRLGPQVYQGALAPWREPIESPARDAIRASLDAGESR